MKKTAFLRLLSSKHFRLADHGAGHAEHFTRKVLTHYDYFHCK